MNSCYTLEDFSDETSEESEDEISVKMDSVSMIYQDTTDGFDLGIDCTEVQQGKNISDEILGVLQSFFYDFLFSLKAMVMEFKYIPIQ